MKSTQNVFCILLQLIAVKATPILKNDQKPGSMPGLRAALGTSYWANSRCDERNLFYENTSKKNLKEWKKRPSGWVEGSLTIGETILNHSVKFLLDGNVYCPYPTKACCKVPELYKEITVKGSKMKNKVIQKTISTMTAETCKKIVEILPESWGSCAFIASGTSLKRIKRGELIDMHDTVIRMGHMPLKGWEKYTGKRTDVVIGRGSIQTAHAGDYSNVKYLIGVDTKMSSYSKNEQYPLQIGRLGAVSVKPQLTRFYLNEQSKDIWIGTQNIASSLYIAMTDKIGKKARGPSTGFREILNVLSSGFCSSLDIYGTTPNCGGYYYNKKYVMKLHHSCELESWALHYLMRQSQTNVCVWI